MKPAKPKTYSVIVVLGTKLSRGGVPGPVLTERVMHGVALFRQGRADMLVFTGGLGRAGITEAEGMRTLAVSAGVPEDHIVIETDSSTTLENAQLTARLMRERGWNTALVVSDRLHLPRAILAFRSFGIRARGSAPPRSKRDGARFSPRTFLAHAAYELIGLLWYVAVIVVKRPR